MAEVKLEGLIEKIKKEGVEEARKLSIDIENTAHKEADRIITAARLEAQKLRESALNEIDKLKTNATAALKQSVRDLLLAVREQMTNLFNGILKSNISQTLTADFLKELIIKIVETWLAKKKGIAEVVVNEKDKEKLQQLVFSQFKQAAETGIEIKVNPKIDKGFRIGIKGQDIYYDFTDESILESLKTFLSPAMVEALTKDNG